MSGYVVSSIEAEFVFVFLFVLIWLETYKIVIKFSNNIEYFNPFHLNASQKQLEVHKSCFASCVFSFCGSMTLGQIVVLSLTETSTRLEKWPSNYNTDYTDSFGFCYSFLSE